MEQIHDKFDNDEFEKRLKNYINRVELLTGAMNELSNMVEKLGLLDKFDIGEFDAILKKYIVETVGK